MVLPEGIRYSDMVNPLNSASHVQVERQGISLMLCYNICYNAYRLSVNCLALHVRAGMLGIKRGPSTAYCDDFDGLNY